MSVAQPVTRYEIAAWGLTGAALVLVLSLHLLSALLGGMLVYQLVHLLARRLPLGQLSTTAARMVALSMLAAIIVAALTAAALGTIAFLRSDAGGLTLLMTKLAEILEGSRALLPPWMASQLSMDVEGLRDGAIAWLRGHAAGLRSMGREIGRNLVHLLVGMIVGAMISLHDAMPDQPLRPFARALLERMRRLVNAFRRVVFAQVRIAVINAILTGIYVAIALPLLGIHLPYAKTLILVTFLFGLIPVVGNVVSNTVIVLVSLSQSLPTAIASLVFLIVIHKLEYFLNARIVGTQINARPWELLVAMLVMEAAFGAGGLIAAPIYYAYLKDELSDRGLI